MECAMAAMCQNWEMRLVQNALMLYKAIWTNRYSVLHGKSWKESKEKLREWVIDAVTNIYNIHQNYTRVLKRLGLFHLKNDYATIEQIATMVG
jgi:hypothetical protein